MTYFAIRQSTNLGNWMFQYAAAQAMGSDVGIALEDETLRAHFEPMREFLGVGKICLLEDLAGVPVYKEPHFRYAEIPRFEGDVVLDGFFQSEKYFNTVAIRSKFGISAEREAYLRGKYGEWLNRAHVTGISVRHGKDYRSVPFKHPFVGKEYFHDCISRIPDSRDFIVCSDDILWCEKFFPREFPEKNFLFVKNETVLDQLYIHSLCRNNIISNSSFSWWGAWLNDNPDKKVFAPSEWFGVRGRTVEKLDWRDIYASGTIVVNNDSAGVRLAWQYVMWFWNWFKRTFYPVKRFVTVTIMGGTH